MNKEDATRLGRMESKVRELGMLMARRMPKGMGFAVLIFDFGDGGFSTYFSNAQRADMIAHLRECADRLELGVTAPPGSPNHSANNPGKA